jgi:uncharacterized repeat protein (TIGR03803 family)
MNNMDQPHPAKLQTFAPLAFLQRQEGKKNRAVKLSRWGTAWAVFLLSAATAIASASAPKFKSILSFGGSNGLGPNFMSVVQGLDGNLYGTTEFGGQYLSCNIRGEGCGTVFQITPAGTLTTLWNFCQDITDQCPDGAYPIGGLALGTDGNFYGTTSGGGKHGGGTVFKITSAGVLTTLYNFCSQFGCADGNQPYGPLVQSTDGNFYGTTLLGGTGGCGGCHGGGTFFKVSPKGKFAKLYDFCTGTCTDGANPSNGLVQASDGNFYGMLTGRSGYFNGDLFEITPRGKLTVRYYFCSLTNCTDGSFPVGSLIQGPDGELYGTTSGGGTYNDGTVFKITLAGTLTTLHSFDYETKGNVGASPQAGLVLGTDGNLYGTASEGGQGCRFGCGTIFKITPAGKLTTLLSFDGPHGAYPYGLFQDTAGLFYGATNTGGVKNDGTIFSESVGLAPFVELLPSYGKVANTIDILGQGFTGATGVSFDGVAAKFNNVSDTYLTAVVPIGALTGAVTVTTFTTSYKSSQIFRVTPQLQDVSPHSGVVGSQVSILGVSLTQTTQVTIGGKVASFQVISDTKLTAKVPVGAKNGQNIVITTLGGSASIGPFEVVPKITSFSPPSGKVGTVVTIAGTTFTGTSKVTFGGVAATSFQVISDGEVKALVPTGAKTGKITVTTPGGTATSPTNFTVT